MLFTIFIFVDFRVWKSAENQQIFACLTPYPYNYAFSDSRRLLPVLIYVLGTLCIPVARGSTVVVWSLQRIFVKWSKLDCLYSPERNIDRLPLKQVSTDVSWCVDMFQAMWFGIPIHTRDFMRKRLIFRHFRPSNFTFRYIFWTAKWICSPRDVRVLDVLFHVRDDARISGGLFRTQHVYFCENIAKNTDFCIFCNIQTNLAQSIWIEMGQIWSHCLRLDP